MPVAPRIRFAPLAPGVQAFWEAAAEALVPWLNPTPPHPTFAVRLVVPRTGLIDPLREALRVRLAPTVGSWRPPPMRTLSEWLDDLVPGAPIEPMARVVCLMGFLDDALPAGRAPRASADRLDLATRLLEVLDALALWEATPCADRPDLSEALLTRFGAQAAHDLLDQDLAVLRRLAAALGAAGFNPVTEWADRLTRLAAHWAAEGVRVGWLAWQDPSPLEAVLITHLERSLPAGQWVRIEPDFAALATVAPLLSLSWPEAFDDAPAPPLTVRHQAWRAQPAGPVPERLHLEDREREAQAAAAWVHARIQEGVSAGMPAPRVAIVALDRWLARRVRALLERAGVLIDDRQGWLLSTTVASTPLMAWLDLVEGGGRRADLLAWLEAHFVASSETRALRAWIERRSQTGEPRGWAGWLTAAPEGEAPPALLHTLAEQAREQGRPQSLRSHLDTLATLLRGLGVERSLAADEAGRQVLAALEGLRRAVGRTPDPRPLAVGDLRALLARVLEQRRFIGAIESPVQMLSLEEAAGRAFEAVLILGASAQALPATPLVLPLVNEPLRALLRLPTAASLARAQQRDLSLLLSTCPRVALSCRSDGVHTSHPSPWVERLHQVAEGKALEEQVADPRARHRLHARPLTRPGQALRRLPEAVSVTAIEHLVDCPFRFLVSDGWRLRAPQDPSLVPGARERGDLVHQILEGFHRACAEQGLPFESSSRPALRAVLEAVTTAVSTPLLAQQEGLLGELTEWQAMREAYLDWALADAAAGWRFQDAEREGRVRIDWGGEAAARSLEIKGRLDRVDQGPQGLRVLDYKLGDPSRLRQRVKDPLQAAQLALYAWMLDDTAPVSVSAYLSLRRDAITPVELPEPTETVLDRWKTILPATLSRIEAGEPLVALGARCENCPARGLCRMGHWS